VIAYWIFNLKQFKSCLNQPIKNKIANSIACISLIFAQYTVKFTAIQTFQFNPDFVFWMVVFVALSSIGFLAIQQRANNLMKYFPFYLFLTVYIILGSTSGIITTAEGILFLIYSVYSAKVVYAYSHNEGLAALLMGLILGVPFGAFF
jgi:hypothetical protein